MRDEKRRGGGPPSPPPSADDEEEDAKMPTAVTAPSVLFTHVLKAMAPRWYTLMDVQHSSFIVRDMILMLEGKSAFDFKGGNAFGEEQVRFPL